MYNYIFLKINTNLSNIKVNTNYRYTSGQKATSTISTAPTVNRKRTEKTSRESKLTQQSHLQQPQNRVSQERYQNPYSSNKMISSTSRPTAIGDGKSNSPVHGPLFQKTQMQ